MLGMTLVLAVVGAAMAQQPGGWNTCPGVLKTYGCAGCAACPGSSTSHVGLNGDQCTLVEGGGGNAYYTFIIANQASGKAGFCAGSLSSCNNAYDFVKMHHQYPPMGGELVCFGQASEITDGACTLEHLNASAFSVIVSPNCSSAGPPPPPPPPPGPAGQCAMHQMQCLMPMFQMVQSSCCPALSPGNVNGSSFTDPTVVSECHSCAERAFGSNLATCACCAAPLLQQIDHLGIQIPTSFLTSVFGQCDGWLKKFPF